MKAVIMAGGDSSRMQPYSVILEKSLLHLGGRPVVRIIADRILKTKISQEQPLQLFPSFEMTFCVLGKYLEDFRWEFRDIPEVKFSPKMDAIGTCSHYFYAGELEQHFGPDEWILLHYADCVTEIDYAEFVAYAVNSGKEACIAVTANAKHDYSEVVVDNTGAVTLLNEKPRLVAPTWTGIACFKHGVIKKVMGDVLFGRRVDFAFDIWPKLIVQNNLSAFRYNGVWKDVGNVVSYQKLREEFSRGDHFI